MCVCGGGFVETETSRDLNNEVEDMRLDIDRWTPPNTWYNNMAEQEKRSYDAELFANCYRQAVIIPKYVRQLENSAHRI